MCRLEPGKLINDNIIDYYLQLVAYSSKQNLHLPKVVVFDTKFYVKLTLSGVRSVLEWTRHEDIFNHDILLVPIYLPDNWALVAVKMKKQRLTYYDSLLGDGHRCLSLIKQYLQQESTRKGHEEVDPANWLGFNDKTIPQQSNSYDYGIFVCLFAESVSREVRPEFEQYQVENIRRKLTKEVLDGVMSEQKEIDESNI